MSGKMSGECECQKNNWVRFASNDDNHHVFCPDSPPNIKIKRMEKALQRIQTSASTFLGYEDTHNNNLIEDIVKEAKQALEVE